MEQRDNLIIVVDAGHGGWDNGASWEGRLEKDDNLRLALAVQKQLKTQKNVTVIMTRDTDVFVELSERADIANNAGANIFISLHRNSYIEPTPITNGVENWIYLTAPEHTERAAIIVLNEVVKVGVQNNRGVKRGNYYVVRRTLMPSMLLEMGYIINEEDNRLFDEKLTDYARAIAVGILCFFGLEFSTETLPPSPEIPPWPPSPEIPAGPLFPLCPACPSAGSSSALVKEAQRSLNMNFGSDILIDGLFGPLTRAAAVRALQIVINRQCGVYVEVDGVFGPETMAAIPEIREGDRGEGALLVQILLALNGYDAGGLDGIFGPKTKTALQIFQRDHYLIPDGIAGRDTITMLLK